MEPQLDRETRLKRLKFRSWHRGTKEADLMIGGFYDRYAAAWNDDEIAWFEAMMDEEDVEIMGWAMATMVVPARATGPLMTAMQRLDYIAHEK